jgi:N-acetyl sugar amidotransferase
MQICSKCVMDTSDSKIIFDDNGVCDHCKDFEVNVKPKWHTDERGDAELKKIIAKIKDDGKSRDFDCIIGMSGGADSSYLLHVAVKNYGLRPLVFHVDGGWNSQIAVNNINVMIEHLDLDLYTEVINWEEMKAFQLAYFRSGLPNIDVPQDHAFIATLYKFAAKHKIKYILNGGNISTEGVRNPLEWLYHGTDMKQIAAIRKLYCNDPLKTFPFSNVLHHKVYLRYIKKVQVVKPLNYLPYIKDEAMKLLADEYGWIAYPQKHFESRFTKFYEGYWLPKKFGYDTRKVQFSSLILTGQLTRKEALERLKVPAISDEEAKHDFDFIATKLDITVDELQKYFEQPNKSHKDYPNQEVMFHFGSKVLKFLGVEKSVKR